MTGPALDALASAVMARWKSEGTDARPGVTEAELASFARKHNVQVPDDFATMWRTANGMAPDDTDADLIRFWPLDEVVPARDECPDVDAASHKGLFVFADWSISAHYYAIKLAPTEEGFGSVAIVLRGAPIPVTNSFAEFLEKYLRRDVFPRAGGNAPARN